MFRNGGTAERQCSLIRARTRDYTAHARVHEERTVPPFHRSEGVI